MTSHHIAEELEVGRDFFVFELNATELSVFDYDPKPTSLLELEFGFSSNCLAWVTLSYPSTTSRRCQCDQFLRTTLILVVSVCQQFMSHLFIREGSSVTRYQGNSLVWYFVVYSVKARISSAIPFEWTSLQARTPRCNRTQCCVAPTSLYSSGGFLLFVHEA